MKKLVRSRHLSFFKKGDEAYLYHDLIGDLLRMDEALVGFLDSFDEPRTEAEARARWKDRFLPPDLDAFLEILPDHRALVPEGEDELLALDGWYPVRGPWILSYEPAKGPPVVGYRDRAREDAVVLERPGPLAARVFSFCDGAHAIREIVAALAPEDAAQAAEVRAAIFRWTHSDRQVLKLLDRPMLAFSEQGLPPYAESTMPYPRLRAPGTPAGNDVASTRDYHKDGIVSADEQFEVRETTLSHAFRVPHPALGGKTYGARLATALLERDLVPAAPGGDAAKLAPFEVAEVGGGTGFLAAAFLDELAAVAPGTFARARWTICDLAPALQRSQVERTRCHEARVRLVRGDAAALPLRSGTIDFLLANEMIADLEAVRVRRDDLERGAGPGPALARRHGLRLDDAPGEFWLNAGAFRFVEEVARVLRPGGRAVLTEFGEVDRYPVESTHLDHREFSIHFGHVRAAAEAAGLEARLETVPALLGLDPRVPVLVTNASFFLVLRAFFREQGIALEKIAHGPEGLAALAGDKLDLSRVGGLRFQPAGERVLGLRPREFKALLLTKRRATEARPARRSVQI